MQSNVEILNQQLSEKEQSNAYLKKENDRLESENKILRQRVDYLLKKYFGGQKSEKLSPNQLEFLLKELEKMSAPEKRDNSDQKKSTYSEKTGNKPRKVRQLPPNLPVEEIVIEPEEVKANPDDYRCIGEERTEELDVTPQTFLKRVYIRKKYVQKAKKDLPPVIGDLPPRLIEGSLASPGLITYLILNRYMDHLPFYRQEQLLRIRYGIHLSRKTMSDWMDCVANWLKPIYNLIREELRLSGYLQIDETPIKYLMDLEGGGGSKLGYFWIYHSPGGYRVYEWHTSRATVCLDGMLKDYKGLVQTDGYSAYDCYARKNLSIELLLCWAHARRKFFDALEDAPKEAGWFIRQIQNLYAIEKRLRKIKAAPSIRETMRQSESQMILNRIEKALVIKKNKHRPQSDMGKAIAYALNDWGKLKAYINHGKAEIDNNLVENAVRPTAIGKKNWLFIGHPEAGEKSAILYTILENCKHLNIDIQEYLRDVLTRLPSTSMTGIKYLMPLNWIKSRIKTQKAA